MTSNGVFSLLRRGVEVNSSSGVTAFSLIFFGLGTNLKI